MPQDMPSPPQMACAAVSRGVQTEVRYTWYNKTPRLGDTNILYLHPDMGTDASPLVHSHRGSLRTVKVQAQTTFDLRFKPCSADEATVETLPGVGADHFAGSSAERTVVRAKS